MNSQSTFAYLQELIRRQGAGFVLLLDPDKTPPNAIHEQIERAISAGVDIFFIGGSFILHSDFDAFVQHVKQAAPSHPVILFPGSIFQLSSHADAILYLSLISGRNVEHLISSQVLAAPMIWRMGLEAISCGYMIVESGQLTSAQFLSNSTPIPRNKPDIALAHALAAQYLGMKTLYLEAGSGAHLTVPEEMIRIISENVTLPLMVGGGIRSPEEAHRKVQAGAQFVVVGNFFEKSGNSSLMSEFAAAIHQRA